MTKLNADTIAFIKKLVKTCSLCGIESVAIEQGLIRGQAEDSAKGIFLLETDQIPNNLEFSSLGIGRVKVLSSRIAMLDEDALTVSFDHKEKDNGDIIVKKLLLSSKKTKIEFSCYDSAKIKAPRLFKNPFFYSFTLSEDTLKVMSKAVSAIETSKISFSSEKDGSVKFRTADVEGDMFDHSVSPSYEILDEATRDHFFHAYEIKYVLPLFRAALDIDKKMIVNISERGALKVKINGLSIYILPET